MGSAYHKGVPCRESLNKSTIRKVMESAEYSQAVSVRDTETRVDWFFCLCQDATWMGHRVFIGVLQVLSQESLCWDFSFKGVVERSSSCKIVCEKGLSPKTMWFHGSVWFVHMFWEMGWEHPPRMGNLLFQVQVYLCEIVIIHPDGWRMSLYSFSQIAQSWSAVIWTKPVGGSNNSNIYNIWCFYIYQFAVNV